MKARGRHANTSVCGGLSGKDLDAPRTARLCSFSGHRYGAERDETERKRGADRIYDRHKVLSAFFRELGVDSEVAAEDACKVEHVISDESFAAVCRFVHKSL